MTLLDQILALSVEERVDIIIALIDSVDGQPINAEAWNEIITRHLRVDAAPRKP